MAGLVEDLADDAGAEAPPLVALDGGVEEAVLTPGYLKAGDGGDLGEEGEGPWGKETSIWFPRVQGLQGNGEGESDEHGHGGGMDRRVGGVALLPIPRCVRKRNAMKI